MRLQFQGNVFYSLVSFRSVYSTCDSMSNNELCEYCVCYECTWSSIIKLYREKLMDRVLTPSTTKLLKCCVLLRLLREREKSNLFTNISFILFVFQHAKFDTAPFVIVPFSFLQCRIIILYDLAHFLAYLKSFVNSYYLRRYWTMEVIVSSVLFFIQLNIWCVSQIRLWLLLLWWRTRLGNLYSNWCIFCLMCFSPFNFSIECFPFRFS